MEVTGDNIEQVFPQRAKIKNPLKKLNFDIANVFINRAPEYYADLIDVYKSFSFDLVIADVAFTGIPFITDKMNIPVSDIRKLGFRPFMFKGEWFGDCKIMFPPNVDDKRSIFLPRINKPETGIVLELHKWTATDGKRPAAYTQFDTIKDLKMHFNITP